MNGILPVGATTLGHSYYREQIKPGNGALRATPGTQQPAPDANDSAAVVNEIAHSDMKVDLALAKEIKLFNSGSLPLKGLYDIELIDDNGDGRVDAGDAVSEYLMIASKLGKDDKHSTQKPVNKIV